jgi:hypothetical protein
MLPGFHVYLAWFCWVWEVEEAKCDDEYRLWAIFSLVLVAAIVGCLGLAFVWCCLSYLKDLVVGIFRFLTCNFFQPCYYLTSTECSGSKKRGCSDCCQFSLCCCFSCSGRKARSSSSSGSGKGWCSCLSLSFLRCSSRKYLCCYPRRSMRSYEMV